MKAVQHRAHRSNRGIFLFELSLLTPIVIVAAISLVDVTRLLRTKNALKEASQAAIRCLTTEGSACTTTTERGALGRLYSYYRKTSQPSILANLRRVPASINERMSPLNSFQFDATVLDAVYTGAQQTQYEEVALNHQVAKFVPYILQDFRYYVRPTSPGNYDIFEQSVGGSVALEAKDITSFTGAVTRTTGRSVVFSIPKPSSLQGFGAGDICSRSIVANGGGQPEGCLLSRIGSKVLSSMMIVFEGEAAGGSRTTPETAQLKLSASYTLGADKTTIELGGQQFSINGYTRAESFLPRGAPIDHVDESLISRQEFIDHGAAKVILPFDTLITVRVQFAKQPNSLNASWTPGRLRVFIPSFEPKRAELTCSNNLDCRALSSGRVSRCNTSPNLNPPDATLKLVRSTAVSATPPNLSSCLPNADSLSSLAQFKKYTINGKTCADKQLVPVTSSLCPAQVTKHQCSSSNKGISTLPNSAGIIVGAPESLASACRSYSSTTPANLPTGTTLKAGEALATTRTVRVMTDAGVRAESRSWQQSCDPNLERARVSRPAAVTQYRQVTPVLVGTVEGRLQSLPAQSSETTQESLSCFPIRELSPALNADLYSSLLGDFSYLLTPHPDKGCSYPAILRSAEQQIEKDPRYEATLNSPVIAGRFELPSGSKPDSCTQFTLGAPSVKKESLRLIGTFPETAPPSECSDGTCVREFVGFSGSTSTETPGVNLQQAVSEAEAAALAYLPTRSREDLTVTITPPSRSTIGPKTYQITTVMKVPLSIGTKSTITHVAHGQMEG